jgi:hypothetical protein
MINLTFKLTFSLKSHLIPMDAWRNPCGTWNMDMSLYRFRKFLIRMSEKRKQDLALYLSSSAQKPRLPEISDV